MRKLIALFVMFVFLMSFSVNMAVADDVEDDEIESETEIVSETKIESEIESDSGEDDSIELTPEDKILIEKRLMMETQTRQTMPVKPDVSCEIDPELQRKLYEINKEIRLKSESGEDVSDLKLRIESLNKDLRAQKERCMNAQKTAQARDPANTKRIAVGAACEVSADLRESLAAYKEKYLAAIESKDFDSAKRIREEASKIEQKINDERKKCIQENIPGIAKDARSMNACQIPPELYEELEKNKYRISELKNIDVEIPEDLRKDIADIESRIADHKAKCNALKLTSEAKESDVRDYYSHRMSQALENSDSEARIVELKELRKEIDETIKNLVEEKKKLSFKEVDGLVEEVKFKAKSTSIGDSETTEDVEVEVEVEGSNVVIQSTDEDVLLTQGDIEFTADDITVDENGIYVGGVLVKRLPKAVFENNENLERHAKRIYEMKLEKDGEKAVYKTKYDSDRRLLGFIKVKAKNEVTVDAETGDVLEQSTPWWNGISTETSEEDSALEAKLASDTELNPELA